MIDEFRNHIDRWRYYEIHLVEQKGTLIDMFVIFLKYNLKRKIVKVVGEVWEAQNAIKIIALSFQTVLQLH